MKSHLSSAAGIYIGGAQIDLLSNERSMPPVRETAETGAIPLIIDGDHSFKYPNVAGIADVYGKENVGVMHSCAHFDIGENNNGCLNSLTVDDERGNP